MAIGIPEHPADQQLLRDLCRYTLAFENHYFQHYRRYLLDLLHHTEDDQQFAAERLTQVIYADAEMVTALQRVACSTNPVVQRAACQALACIDQKQV